MLQYVTGECTTGRTESAHGDARRAISFYLNIGRPATCSGIITSFSFCYHSNRPSEVTSEYLTTFAVYRLNGTVYNPVSRVLEVRRTREQLLNGLGNENFACSNFTLDQSVPVVAGDVLGACIFTPSSGTATSPLYLVGRHGGVRDRMLRIRPAPLECSETSVPSSVSTNLNSNNNLALHLYATIINDTSSEVTTTGTVSTATTLYSDNITTELITNTVRVVTDPTSTRVNTANAPSASNAVLVGGIVGGVVCVILLLIAILTVVTIVLVIVLRQKCSLPPKLHAVSTQPNQGAVIGECFLSA